MSDIQSLINMLQSNNPDKRYDACEELRVSPSLPPEALDALRLAINDENPDVADAARRALALHAPTLTQDVVKEIEPEQDKTITNPVKLWPYIGFLAGLIPGLIFFVLLFLVWNNDDVFYLICFGSAGIPCG